MHPIVSEVIAADRRAERLAEAARWRAVRAATPRPAAPSPRWRVALAVALVGRLAPELAEACRQRLRLSLR